MKLRNAHSKNNPNAIKITVMDSSFYSITQTPLTVDFPKKGKLQKQGIFTIIILIRLYRNNNLRCMAILVLAFYGLGSKTKTGDRAYNHPGSRSSQYTTMLISRKATNPVLRSSTAIRCTATM